MDPPKRFVKVSDNDVSVAVAFLADFVFHLVPVPVCGGSQGFGRENSLPLAVRREGADSSTARNLYRTNPPSMQGRIFSASPSLIIFIKRRFNGDVLLVVYDEQPDVQGFL